MGRELRGCTQACGPNKSLSQRHPVTCLPVNDTSSSSNSLNDLVYVAPLVVRESAGGSGEMSLVIVWRWRQARGEMKGKDKEGRRERITVSFWTCCTHKGERHRGTFHVIKQTFIRYDLGSYYKTTLTIRGRGREKERWWGGDNKLAQCYYMCGWKQLFPHKHFLRELKFG